MVTGVALVLMETLNDFGTVQYFGVNSFTAGIYRTWMGMGEPAAAAQLAAVLTLFIACLVLLERLTRGRGKVHHTTSKYRQLPRYRLNGGHALLALLVNGLPVSRIGLSTYRSLIGTVMQEDFLFSGSIFDNISMFDSEADEAQLRTLLEEHAAHTGSLRAKALLADWPAARAAFWKVAPR